MSNDTEREFGGVQDIVEPMAATIIELNREVQRLKSENARLAAHNSALKDACRSIISPIRPHWRTTIELASKAFHMDPTDALRDLLAPTIELLEQHTFDEHGQPYQSPSESQIQSELGRLRAACGQKEQK